MTAITAGCALAISSLHAQANLTGSNLVDQGAGNADLWAYEASVDILGVAQGNPSKNNVEAFIDEFPIASPVLDSAQWAAWIGSFNGVGIDFEATLSGDTLTFTLGEDLSDSSNSNFVSISATDSDFGDTNQIALFASARNNKITDAAISLTDLTLNGSAIGSLVDPIGGDSAWGIFDNVGDFQLSGVVTASWDPIMSPSNSDINFVVKLANNPIPEPSTYAAIAVVALAAFAAWRRRK